MTTATLAWFVLAATGVAAIVVDLVLTLRPSRRSFRVAVAGTVAWTVVGLAFAAAVRALVGAATAGDYLTVFVLEKSLSLDNVAVFAVVLSAFAVPASRQPRVLFGGILAALVLRIAFVLGGLAIVSALHPVLIAFGAVLVIAGLRMARAHGDSAGPPRVVTWLQARRLDTAVAALVALALTDLVFAIDSVPAAFAVTHEAFPVVAANVFAVLGLRPLYDVLAAAIDRLAHLERALGVLLALIGVALVVEPVWKVPEWMILSGVVVTLGAGIAASLVPQRRAQDHVSR